MAQNQLAASFHKVLQVPLPNWGSVRNCLTVWKRTRSTVLEGDRYAYIPVRTLPHHHSYALLRSQPR